MTETIKPTIPADILERSKLIQAVADNLQENVSSFIISCAKIAPHVDDRLFLALMAAEAASITAAAILDVQNGLTTNRAETSSGIAVLDWLKKKWNPDDEADQVYMIRHTVTHISKRMARELAEHGISAVLTDADDSSHYME